MSDPSSPRALATREGVHATRLQRTGYGLAYGDSPDEHRLLHRDGAIALRNALSRFFDRLVNGGVVEAASAQARIGPMKEIRELFKRISLCKRPDSGDQEVS